MKFFMKVLSRFCVLLSGVGTFFLLLICAWLLADLPDDPREYD